jgi:hypothetical protein
VDQVQDNLKAAYTHYYECKGQADFMRKTALELWAEAIADKGALAKEKVLKDLREREQQRATARKLRFVRGKMRTGSTTMVTVVDADGQRRDITDKLETERAILRKNKEKFSQSFHTAFYQSPLKEDFGFQGTSLAAQAVLAGLYETDYELDQFMLDVMQQWQKPEAV